MVAAGRCRHCGAEVRQAGGGCPNCDPSGAWDRFVGSLKITPGVPAPPPRLWAVIGVMAVVGLILVGLALHLIAESLPLFGYGSQQAALATFVILVSLIPLLLGGGLVYFARRLQQGDGLARVLSVLTCSAIAVAGVLTGSRDLGWVLSALACLAVVVLLTADPSVTKHFSGPDARYAVEPVQVVSARAIMAIVGVCLVNVGAGFLVLSPWAASLAAYGIVWLAMAAGMFWLSRRLAVGDATARVLTTGLALVYLIVAMAAGHGEPGVIMSVGLAVAVPGLLWFPESSRRYFQSLDRPTHGAILAVERAIDGFLASGGTARQRPGSSGG